MSPRGYRSEARQAASAETRTRILAAARSLLSDERRVTFTVDAIAEKADVARMTVYNQFGSKRGLVEALSDELAARGGIARLPAAFQARDAVSGLQLLVDVFVGFWDAERLAIRRLRAFSALDPELAGSTRDLRRRQAIGVVVRRVAAEAGHPPGLDEERAVDLLWVLTGFECYEHLAELGHSAKDIAGLITATAKLSLGLPEGRPS